MSKKFNIKEWQKKHLLKEHTLGQLPSEKLMKMKWNPLTESEPLKEYDKRMMGLISNRDKQNFAETVQNYVYEFADDGYDEKDIQKYMSKLLQSYVRKYYKDAIR